MSTTIQLDPNIDARLEALARATGRSKEFYLKELILQGMEDLEDAYLGALEADRVERQLRKLDSATARRLGLYLRKLVAETTDPRERGKSLTGPMTGLWRYRVGDYRIVCELVEQRLVVLVVQLGHRSRIYE